MIKHVLGLAAALALSALTLQAQRGPAPAPDPKGANDPAAADVAGRRWRGQLGDSRRPDRTRSASARRNNRSVRRVAGRRPVGDLAQGLPNGETIPLLPEARKLMESRQSKDDPEANCLPTGVPRVRALSVADRADPTHKKATHIFFLFEGNIHSYRQIFMDGRKHPADPDPTWYGHSIGWCEGDTLVIDTVGFNDKFWFDFRGHPHTEKLHTIERWTRKDLGTLVNEITIDDPGAYSKPFTVSFTARLRPDEELMEYICQENEQDVKHIKGPAGTP